jgi:ribosomal protein L2
MIVDVQNEMNKVDESQEFTDARETEQSGDKMKYVKTGLGKSRSNIKRNRSKGDEMTKTMSPHKSSSRKILAGSPDPARHSPLAAIAERDGPTATPHALDSMREGNSVMSGSHFTNSFHENPNLEAVHELPEMHANMNGEFFEAVFSGGKTRTERQTKSIYQ